MFFDFGQHGAQAIGLEIEHRAPDRSLLDQRLLRCLAGQEVVEQVKQRLEIDELGSSVSVAGLECAQHFVSHILGQTGVAPHLIKPG